MVFDFLFLFFAGLMVVVATGLVAMVVVRCLIFFFSCGFSGRCTVFVVRDFFLMSFYIILIK